MSEPFVAEIDIFPYPFAPLNWAYCDGQLLQISQNPALFSLIGTIYGGDGMTTMGLPNLQGRAPLGDGRGPGLSHYQIGQPSGQESVTLTSAELPEHNHTFRGEGGLGEDTQNADSTVAVGRVGGTVTQLYHTGAGALAPMSPSALSPTGSNNGHENRQPFLALNFCIALYGIYPSRS